jgi:hypothetical protein
MRIHPLVRLLLIAAGLTIVFGLDRAAMWPCAGAVIAAYLLLGRIRMLLRFALLVSPFVLTAGALWVFVYYGHETNLRRAVERLHEPGSSFVALLRTMLGTSLIFLSLRAVPDGELYFVLRRMGAPRTAALLFASGSGLVGTVREAVERSLVALRAHGLMRASIGSRLRNIGRAVGLTWVSGLTVTALRAEVKWDGNGFLQQLDTGSTPVSVAPLDTIVAAFTACIVFLLVFLPAQILYAPHLL